MKIIADFEDGKEMAAAYVDVIYTGNLITGLLNRYTNTRYTLEDDDYQIEELYDITPTRDNRKS